MTGSLDDSDNITRLAAANAKRLDGLSEDALALLFVAHHGTKLRFVARWGQWLQWTDVRWKEDDTLHVFDLVRDVCREALGNRARKKFDARTVAAVEKLSKADRRVAATVDQWDKGQDLLNAAAGPVDLPRRDRRT
jgi:putative DNA primase/helicase